MIFFNNNTSIECEVSDISPDKVLYTELRTGKSKKVKVKKISIITLQNGSCYAYTGGQREKRTFFNDEYDLIFPVREKAILATEVKLKASMIEYKDFLTDELKRLPRQSVIATYNRSKTLSPLANIEKVAASLAYAVVPKISKPQEDKSEKTEVESPKTEDLNPPILNTKLAEKEVIDIETEEVEKPKQEPEPEEEIPGPPMSQEEFQKQAKEKVQQFMDFVELVMVSERRGTYLDNIINEAILLFTGTSIIEVSSLNNPNKRYSPVEYFTHIRYDLDAYDKIEINVIDGDLFIVTTPVKAPDGRYFATVTFGYRFKGYRDQMVIYEDFTTKKANVELRKFEPEIDGKKEVFWEILISDILVEETK